MYMRRIVLALLVFVTLSAFAGMYVVNAQETCSALVNTALSELGINCANLNRNTTCFGHPAITHASFVGTAPAAFYTQPGDHADLAETEAIQTGPLDLEQGEWGLNVMNVNANLPADKGVVFVQFGGVEVENGVEPENAVEVSETVDDRTPMQQFYVRTGIGGTPCAEAPSLLFIQGPNNAAADILVYDQPVRIQSTIVLRLTPAGDVLELIVLSGIAILNAGTPNEIIVPPGFVTSIELGSDLMSLGIEGDADDQGTIGTWSLPRRLTIEELEELAPIEDIPGNLIHYEVNIPQIVMASGVGGATSILVFPDETALAEAEARCADGSLADDVCQYLGLE